MEILSTKSAGILTIEFNRAERKNAITNAMYISMAHAILDGEGDPEVRAILITGKPEIFTAGNDLEDFLKNSTTADDDRGVFQFMRALSGATKPVVAAVSGAAIGIGTTMLMHCDLVYAADNAKFSLPFSQLGLCPEFASSLLLQQIAGYPRAAEKLLLGEAFGAAEAAQMGLVSKVLAVEDLLPHAHAQAAKLVALPALSVRTTKALMKQSRNEAVRLTMKTENELFFSMLQGGEAKEAFTAFFEKRKPDFSRFS